MSVAQHETELVPISRLVSHPRNYRVHPEDQIAHLAQSMREHGFYRNVVIARDGTILAGHGVVEAARQVGLKEVRVVRLPIEPDSPAALKVLTGDNEIEHLAEQDDRLLSELLRQIAESEASLLGTGYDEAMLANLVFVTRPASEIQSFDEASHWVGMPEHGEAAPEIRLIMNFATEEDRASFMGKIGAEVPTIRLGPTWSLRWPLQDREDLASLRFEATADA